MARALALLDLVAMLRTPIGWYMLEHNRFRRIICFTVSR
jgi:hypothetical protein